MRRKFLLAIVAVCALVAPAAVGITPAFAGDVGLCAPICGDSTTTYDGDNPPRYTMDANAMPSDGQDYSLSGADAYTAASPSGNPRVESVHNKTILLARHTVSYTFYSGASIRATASVYNVSNHSTTYSGYDYSLDYPLSYVTITCISPSGSAYRCAGAYTTWHTHMGSSGYDSAGLACGRGDASGLTNCGATQTQGSAYGPDLSLESYPLEPQHTGCKDPVFANTAEIYVESSYGNVALAPVDSGHVRLCDTTNDN